MAWRQTCLGATLMVLGVALVAVQGVSAALYLFYPVEWTLSGLWAGALAVVTGLVAILDRPCTPLMSVATLFGAILTMTIHATGAVLVQVLMGSSTWRHTRYVRRIDDFYVMVSWTRVVLAILVIVFDSAVLCHTDVEPGAEDRRPIISGRERIRSSQRERSKPSAGPVPAGA